MAIKDILLEQGPKIALALMAARQGGPQAAAAFQQGMAEAQMRRQLLERQGMADQRAAEMHQAQLANLDADNQRQADAVEMQKFQRVLELVNNASALQAQTATDPAAADAALQQQATAAAQGFGIDPSRVTPLVPSVAPMISARKKKQAQELYERAQKRYDPKGENPDWENAITLQTGEQFGNVTPAQLRQMFEAPAVDASGAPALPPKAQRALQIVDLGGRKMAIDPTQLQHGQEFQETPAASAGGTDSEPLVAIMGPDGAPVLVPRREAVGKRPASTREQGRPVQSGDANRIIDIDVSLKELDALEQTLGTTGAASKIGAMLPNVVTELTGWGSDAKQRQATIDLVKQIIGKTLEGGVLRREDEYKYVKILPTIGDPPDVAKAKLDGLRREITTRRAITLEGLADAGFDTSKFTAPSAPMTPTQGGGGADTDPLGLFK